MFQLQQASFALQGRTLLHPLDLNFQPHQVYGLIGHNGSGKSTLLKLLTRQYPLAGGHILLDDKPIFDYSSREYARQVAYLPQHLPAATSLTARELVAMGRYAWNGLLGGKREQDEAAIAQAFALTHTEAFADRMVDTLSGGERSRIWLAMCLAQQSRFLLLDEPLAALDIAHQIEVMELIRHLSGHLQLGIVIVIHDINLAARYCDQLIALKQGRLLLQGTPDEIMNTEALHSIYTVNMDIIAHPKTGQPIALP
mgnify:FL=1